MGLETLFARQLLWCLGVAFWMLKFKKFGYNLVLIVYKIIN